MDITNFVVQGRDRALLYGDYAAYHALLSKRLLSSRKKLGTVTKNRGKYQRTAEMSASDVAQNHENVHLLLLTSERAWAQAMSIKSAHTASKKGIRGRTRSHVVSRLEKAARTAEHLAQLLFDSSVSRATTDDILQARAYASMIRGAMQFEKQVWEACLRSYAVSRILYSALATATKGDIFRDLLSETIDPSIRFAAYQLNTPRTVPIPAVARNAFPRNDEFLVQEVNKMDPAILRAEDVTARKGSAGPDSTPRLLTWRSRGVKIEDARIAEAWAAVEIAKARLAERLASPEHRGAPRVAGEYDEILTATQDAVDATKQAIDELKGEGVSQGDPRMQSLQITRTAVNYELISWRIGRNRVLTGPHDGATEDDYRQRSKAKAMATPHLADREKELPLGRRLARLKEKTALYDGTLQNLQTIKELPGIAADEGLVMSIGGCESYFQALKCLSIARSHAMIGKFANALALLQRSLQLAEESVSKLQELAEATIPGPLHAEVARQAAEYLRQVLDGELQRHRAIVHVENLRRQEQETAAQRASPPLLERLGEYPSAEVDLTNIVEFPPKMALIPMKPILLDVAWNYIHYPGKGPQATGAPTTAGGHEPAAEPAQQQKRGWFSFGRS